MLAYHNDPAVKAKYVNRMKAHMEADNLVQGIGWTGAKGCAVGCTFDNYDHVRGPIEIGVPEILLRLEDTIFEHLPWSEARQFPLAFLEAIPVGADLSLVWPRFALWLLADQQHGVLQHTDDVTRPSVENVIELYRRWIAGDKPVGQEFKAAEAAAEAAARAAWAAGAAEAAAAEEAAAWAARAAAEAAWAAAARAAAAGTAAWAAAWTAGASGAAADFWLAARNELLRLLRKAPVSGG